MPQAPLHGLRVVDLATRRAELAGRVLADLGAEVLKVEPPGGAEARWLPPFEAGREADPQGSLYWASIALGKRSLVLDVFEPEGTQRLKALLQDADVFIESFDPGTLEPLGLDYEALSAENPRLVYASVTPFGQDGPHAGTPATDLTIEAAGGLVGLQGDGDRPPIPLGLPQAGFHGGAQAAAEITLALWERLRSGRGQHLDVSMQCAVVWTLMNATGYPPNTGGNPPGTSEFRAAGRPEIVPGVDVPAVEACADGLAFLALGIPGVGERSMHALLRWGEAVGTVPEDLRGANWERWISDLVEERLSVARLNTAFEAIATFLRTRTKRELMDFAVETGALVAPVYDVADLLTDPQLATRGYWTTVAGRTHPGPFARLTETPLAMGAPAPALGDAEPRWSGPPLALPSPSAATATTADGVFAGLKVADFAWVGVGPMISKALADHGATVVHVESESRLDVLRQLPPFKDGLRGTNRSQFQPNFNTSKLGLALDLATDAGRELARRLVAWADVVVESFTPGTMRKLGLDYATLSDDREDLVMLSTCMRGQTGPERSFSGFGTHGAAVGGFFAITGWPDRPPVGPWGAYTDFVAPRYGIAALVSALMHREQTGRGQYIDLSQIEAAMHFLEPLLLDYTVNGRVAGAVGHESPYACPHGVYRTAGEERYVAIAVESAKQWKALRTVAPLEDFADASLEKLEARIERRDAIETRLQTWCAEQEPFELAARLQQAGVPAYVVLRPTDLYEDPQLLHREFFVTLEHAVMGPTPYDGLMTRFSRTPGRLRRAGPTIGEHTEEVLRDVLGLSDDEITQYAIAGALT
jgi:crotonobetainyl-CoA:carnitine CoA-transferase CaiB-like acyl-CoA transferase